MIRVLHVASADLWAGAEVQLLHLLRALSARRDIELAVVLLNEGVLASRLRELGIKVYVIDESRQSSVLIWVRLVGLLRRFRPHIVHAHRTKEGILSAFATLVTRDSISIRTVHGSPEHSLNASFRRRFSMWLERLVASRMHRRIIGVSAALAEQLNTAYPGARVVCIANGLDAELVQAEAARDVSATADPSIHICFAGRFSPVKRLDLFVAMADELVRRNSGAYSFVLIGDGPQRAELENRVRALGLEKYIRFAGFHANCLPLVRDMDAIVLTSDHEGLPMIVLEALSLGVPVVAHAVGGLPHLLKSIESCRLVETQTSTAFADAIESLPGRPAGSPRRNLLPPEYTAAHCASEHNRLYRELVA